MEIADESFIIFKPKFALSGDFYWFSQVGSLKYVAAIDCTGHGVPGAMMTVMMDSALNHFIKNKGCTSPSEILKGVDVWVNNRLHRSQECTSCQIRDGADASLMVYDEASRKLEFASAHSSLFLQRDGKIEFFKGSRYSIGENSERRENVKDTTLEVRPDDRIFCYTDGVTDQFGGSKQKKFGRRRLQALLEETSYLPLREQEKKVLEAIEAWGDGYPQVDDILMLGIQFD